jgi:gamma-glutamylputrescine oxidase
MMEAIDPYGSTWYAATAVPHPERERLTFDLDVDVCVVGGGLAGLCVAREVARRGWSVAVLEARRVAWNASGRNVGFVLPGFSEMPEGIISRVGKARAKALWGLSQAGVEYVRNTIAETKMPGVDPADGWLFVSKSDRPKQLSALAALLRDELNTDVEIWPAELTRAKLKTTRYFQAIHFPTAFHIHPLNYALGLAAAAEAAGVRIFENTPALSIDPAGVRKRIVTPSARVRAAQVVLAGNVHLGAVMPDIAKTLLPIRTYVMTTEPLGERVLDAIDYRGAVSDGEGADNHYRVTPDGRLMWSGRVTMWPGNPRRYGKRLRRDIRRVYPQLGKVEISHAWSGTLGKAVHKMPQIGEVSPGLWLASAFSGHGLNTTAMAGEIIARAIVENDETWKLFAPYELVWAGGAAGRAATQIAYWVKRIGSGADAYFARNREANRLAQAEKAQRQAEAEAARAAEAAVQAEAQKESEAAAQAMAQAEAPLPVAEVPPEPAPVPEPETLAQLEASAIEAVAAQTRNARKPASQRKRKAKRTEPSGDGATTGDPAETV